MRSKTNPYPGVNAHLNSYLQAENDWQSFHAAHIVHLSDALNEWLPEGYFAKPEESLQIGGYSGEGEPLSRSTVRPDVSIMRVPQGDTDSSPDVAIAPTFTMPLVIEELEPENKLTNVVIYRMEGSSNRQIVTQIELLSPANKRGGSGFGQYRLKRLRVIQTEVNLVEIDYLHHRPPVVEIIPEYPDDERSYPHYILTSRLLASKADFYGIGVLAPLPKIALPLVGEDAVIVDFGAVYNTTLARLREYHTQFDYTTDPPAIDRYSETDRTAIRAFLDT
ncbi:MAG: DUF4058 family protein, partial [Chloroflexota bacterium]